MQLNMPSNTTAYYTKHNGRIGNTDDVPHANIKTVGAGACCAPFTDKRNTWAQQAAPLRGNPLLHFELPFGKALQQFRVGLRRKYIFMQNRLPTLW